MFVHLTLKDVFSPLLRLQVKHKSSLPLPLKIFSVVEKNFQVVFYVPASCSTRLININMRKLATNKEWNALPSEITENKNENRQNQFFKAAMQKPIIFWPSRIFCFTMVFNNQLLFNLFLYPTFRCIGINMC